MMEISGVLLVGISASFRGGLIAFAVFRFFFALWRLVLTMLAF